MSGRSCFLSYLHNLKHTQVLKAGDCSVIADVEESGHDSVGRVINVPDRSRIEELISLVSFHLKRKAKTRASWVMEEVMGVASCVAAQYWQKCAGLHRMRAYSWAADKVCGFLDII